MAELADVETSSANYARRFAGKTGRYLLDVQARCVRDVLSDLPRGTLLDVGGAHGQLVDPIEAAGWRMTIVGSGGDCCRNLRELHGKRDVPYQDADLLHLPFEARGFDVVVSVRLLSHMDDWQGLLAEMCRVARGCIVIDYPSTKGLNSLTPLLFGLKRRLEGNTRTYRSFSRSEIERELARHGFRIGRVEGQFFLPMVVHRVLHAALPLRWFESLSRAIGLTRWGGSPVILRADRER